MDRPRFFRLTEQQLLYTYLPEELINECMCHLEPHDRETWQTKMKVLHKEFRSNVWEHLCRRRECDNRAYCQYVLFVKDGDTMFYGRRHLRLTYITGIRTNTPGLSGGPIASVPGKY